MSSSDIMALIRGDFKRLASINHDDSAGTISLAGVDYSLDDSNAVNSMPHNMRPKFWSVCSDRAKDSDTYRAYAKSQLGIARIKLLEIPEDKQLSILNNATKLVSLKNSLKKSESYSRDWFKKLFNSEDVFDFLLNNLENIITLIDGFVELGIETPIDTFKKITLPKLYVILPKAYNVIEILKALKGEFKNPYFLDSFLLLDIGKLKLIVNKEINLIAVMRGFIALGVNDPWRKILSLNDAERECLFNDPSECFSIMKSLKKLKYKDPLPVFMSLDTQKRKKLTGPDHDAKFDLLAMFDCYSDPDPLETLFTLDEEVADLLLNNAYEAFQIMTALCESGEKYPLNFMRELGIVAISTMLNFCPEYVCRIGQLGNKIKDEFVPKEDLFTPSKVPVSQSTHTLFNDNERDFNRALLVPSAKIAPVSSIPSVATTASSSV